MSQKNLTEFTTNRFGKGKHVDCITQNTGEQVATGKTHREIFGPVEAQLKTRLI